MSYNIDEVDLIFDEFDERVAKVLNNFKNEMRSIRAGRANPHILDKIVVDYYGVPTPLKQIGNIQVPEARMLLISVWDTSILKEVEKAIIAANTGIMPTNDGKVLRMVFPELTQERRKELCKSLKSFAENTKVALRNARRDINDSIKKMKKDSLISEDDAAVYEKDVDKKLASQIEIVDKMTKDKEQEIMSV